MALSVPDKWVQVGRDVTCEHYFEIAVRFPLQADHPNVYEKYSGYIVCEGGYMIGRNTDSH